MMKSSLLLDVWIVLCIIEASRALEKEEAPTICTSPAGTCYTGSQLLSDEGTKYYSFQGIRSVTGYFMVGVHTDGLKGIFDASRTD